MNKQLLASTPQLRDGVEVFIYPPHGDDYEVLFLFLSNRRKLRIKCEKNYTALLRQLAKLQTLSKSLSSAGVQWDNKSHDFINFLHKESIILFDDPLMNTLLPNEYTEQYKRQIYFLIDVLKSPEKAIHAQLQIYETTIAIFGLGAVGSSILLQLCMMGFRNFIAIDYAEIEKDDIARTPYAIEHHVDMSKINAAQSLIENFAFNPNITCHKTALTTQSDLNSILKTTDIIVNTADEPYIGYTNIQLSRFSLTHDVPLLAAGGFDAHLASLGEMIIPYITPCADCYANFFDESLKDWNPVEHPVKERSNWFGGLGSLSTFSASSGALNILSYVISQNSRDRLNGGRGEFHFTDYRLDKFTVDIDSECNYCKK